MVIKYLCFSGGGIIGLPMYGTIKRLHQLKFWEHKNIKTIYGCSVGAIIGLIVLLDISWNWIDDYFIKRPWKNIFDIDNIDYIKYISEKGLIDINTWYKIITPLLKSKNISPDITMLELYNLTNIKFNIYSTKLIGIESKIINHETEPHMKLLLAISITTSIPGLSKPIYYNKNFLMDGGLLNNNPINDCCKYNNHYEILNICNDKCDDKFEINNNYTINNNLDKYINNDISDNILDFDTSNNILDFDTSNCENITNIYDNINRLQSNIDNSCNIIEYTELLIRNLVKHIITIHCNNNVCIENKINIGIGNNNLDIESWFNILFNEKNIEKYISFGYLQAEKFYIKKYKINCVPK